MLEAFFIRETARLLDLYESLKNIDPRNNGVTSENRSLDEEITMVKNTWEALVMYAQEYEYHRFDKMDLDLEKFFIEKIHE